MDAKIAASGKFQLPGNKSSRSLESLLTFVTYRSRWRLMPSEDEYHRKAQASPYTREDAEAEQRTQPPCCVCKEEKSKRDECMLFSKSADPAADCRSLVDQYKSCMVGYGFKV
ncbi:unnamed protein product [Clonostachys rosea f. rosea IK726]|uniref:Cytochrome c oxidase copper chaperone n=3 Tax=Bionectria ochroleuca TaxID=29856 RepID=A0A0B7JJG3_BIOOC|nr:unnamed protein product [Clonostachys rosea f. rosea IK726]CAG9949328.1 unnamed protein product [Clonostachys rosea f. rosea IK726]